MKDSQFEAFFDKTKMITQMYSNILKALFRNDVKYGVQKMCEDKLGLMENQKVVFRIIDSKILFSLHFESYFFAAKTLKIS